MALTLGRAGIDVDLTSPASWNPNGDEVTFDVTVSPDDNDDKQFLVEQLVGLVGSQDEPVVPVTWSAWPAVDGFYRDLDLDLSMVGAALAGAPWRLRGRMRRMAGFSSPVVESRLLHRLRDGSSVAAADAQGLVGVPGSASRYRRDTVALTDLASRDARKADGTTGSVLVGTWASNAAQTDATWHIAAADFYEGACQIARFNGGDSRVILGRQAPGDVDANTGWIMSNGLLYLVPSEAIGGTAGTLTLACWGGAAFESATELELHTPSGTITFHAISILRNSPEAATVRLLVRDSFYLDLSIRRGDRNVTGYYATEGLSPFSIGVRVNEAGSTAGLTDAVQRDGDDSDGNRWVLSSTLGTPSASGSAGSVAAALATAVDFSVGHVVGGSGATGIDTAQALANQYAAVTSERARLVLP